LPVTKTHPCRSVITVAARHQRPSVRSGPVMTALPLNLDAVLYW
jgi:hypothetical protein